MLTAENPIGQKKNSKIRGCKKLSILYRTKPHKFKQYLLKTYTTKMLRGIKKHCFKKIRTRGGAETTLVLKQRGEVNKNITFSSFPPFIFLKNVPP